MKLVHNKPIVIGEIVRRLAAALVSLLRFAAAVARDHLDDVAKPVRFDHGQQLWPDRVFGGHGSILLALPLVTTFIEAVHVHTGGRRNDLYF
jgi:hypothetical protein